MVCLDTPASRDTSSAFRPASTCLSTAMISASVCLALDMPLPLFRTAKSYSVLCGFRGAGHQETGLFLGSQCKAQSGKARAHARTKGLRIAGGEKTRHIAIH